MSQLGKQTNRILLAVRRGDRDAQRQLFELTYNHLKAVAYNYARDKNDWEDILSEAYLKIFRYAAAFDDSKDGYNWMCKIVQNTAYDYNAKHAPTLPLDDALPLADGGQTEDDFVGRDAVLRAMDKLSEEDRRLLYLQLYEGLSLAEIARLTGSKKSTVHKRLSALKAKILKEIEQDGGR